LRAIVPTKTEIVSAAMRILGQSKSRKKAAAARRNGKKFKGKKVVNAR
jgi:hypothetical protein